MRSLYKVPYISRANFTSFIKNKKINNIHKNLSKFMSLRRTKIPLHLLFWNKASKINKKLILFKRIGVYNGKLFLSVILNKYSLGYKIGELVLTKRTVKHKGKIAKKIKTIGKKKLFSSNYNLTLKKYFQRNKIKKWV